MYFTINIYKYLLGLEDTFRLKNNGEWRGITDYREINLDEDMYFSTYNEAMNWLEEQTEISLNGELIVSNIKQSSFLNTNFLFEIVVHRDESVLSSTLVEEQVKPLLESIEDYLANILVIDYQGNVKLMPTSQKVQKYEYAVHIKPLPLRKKKEICLEQLYMTLLEGWSMHMQTGRTVYLESISGLYDKESLSSFTSNNQHLLLRKKRKENGIFIV